MTVMTPCPGCAAPNGTFHLAACTSGGPGVYYSKILTYDEINEAEERKKREEKFAQTRTGLINAIPRRYKDALLSNYNTQDMRYRDDERQSQKLNLGCVMDYACDMTEDFKYRNLIMFGTTGTGKTHLAYGVYRHLLSHFVEARYVKIYEMLDDIQSCYRYNSVEKKSDAIKRYVSPSVLIVDEVGEQFCNEAEKRELFRVFNDRYDHERPTVIATNEDEEGIKRFMGEKVFSRLLENNSIFLPFDWRDIRAL